MLPLLTCDTTTRSLSPRATRPARDERGESPRYGECPLWAFRRKSPPDAFRDGGRDSPYLGTEGFTMSILKNAYNGGKFSVVVGTDAQGIKHALLTDVAPETPDAIGIAETVFHGANVTLRGGIKMNGFKAKADERTVTQLNALFSAMGIPPIVKREGATERVSDLSPEELAVGANGSR